MFICIKAFAIFGKTAANHKLLAGEFQYINSTIVKQISVYTPLDVLCLSNNLHCILFSLIKLFIQKKEQKKTPLK